MGKVKQKHLERKACVYVRQSSLAQVRSHRESALRQYSLRERAISLGWQADRVEVIDEDQGKSGADADKRAGFQRLVSDVALGQVGGILGLEMSRLARSCADWHRLLEVAALSKALIIDEEGVYDPNHYNDRLLLGLKGTLSEAELHFLKQRMIGGRRNKAQRGEFRIRLPAGYVWEPGEGIRQDPDERVRSAIEMFFRCFERVGTALRVVRYSEEHDLLFPRRDGWGSLDVPVTWGPLSISRCAVTLKNPLYTGAYVYNRHGSEENDPEDPCTQGRIFIRDSHPGYITMEQHEKDVARLASNRFIYAGARNKGSAREGKSLLQGIVLCGRCGQRMWVYYQSSGNVVYTCKVKRNNRICQIIQGRHVERLVEKVLMEVFSREELDLAIGALEKFEKRAEELDTQWQKRIEAARYEAEKASRRYHRVEPENRLVARTLESDWNARLEELERLEKEFEQARRRPPLELTTQQRAKIRALVEDIPRLWKAPTTRHSRRKEILRTVIEDVTCRNQDDPWCVEVSIRWKSGTVTRHRAERVKKYPHTTAPEIIARIAELAGEKTDREIATVLNQEGYRSGYRNEFTLSAVTHLRKRNNIWKKPRRSSEGSKSEG
ncbi:recombinase family protein [Planctomycetota bacterium]